MFTIAKFFPFFLSISIVMSLTACGGGGSGSNPSTSGVNTDEKEGSGNNNDGDGKNNDNPKPAITYSQLNWPEVSDLSAELDDFETDYYQLTNAINDSGQGVAVWRQAYEPISSDNSYSSVIVSTLTDDVWAAPLRLDNLGASASAYRVNAVIDQNGVATVVWIKQKNWSDDTNPTPYGVYHSRFQNGAWTTPSLISEAQTTNTIYWGEVRTVVDTNSNNVYTVWKQINDNEPSKLKMSHWNGESWSSPIDVLSSTSQVNSYVHAFELAIHKSGKPVIVWGGTSNAGNSNDTQGLWIQTYDTEVNTWDSPELLFDDASVVYSLKAKDNNSIAFVTNRDNDRTVAFYNSDLGTHNTLPLTGVDTPVALTTHNGDVAIAYAVFRSPDDTTEAKSQGVFRTFTATQWSEALSFEDKTPSVETHDIRLNFDGSGNLMVHWVQAEAIGQRQHTYGAIIDIDSNTVSNTQTLGDKKAFDLITTASAGRYTLINGFYRFTVPANFKRRFASSRYFSQ